MEQNQNVVFLLQQQFKETVVDESTKYVKSMNQI